jgi:hypothetical protein
MSEDVSIGVRVPIDAAVADLVRDVEAGYRRAEKSEPGERTDVAGYEASCSGLELRALRALRDGRGVQVPAPEPAATTAGLFVEDGRTVTVSLMLPLGGGARVREAAGRAAPAPAVPMKIRDDLRGRRLVMARFRAQLDSAIAALGEDRTSALSPSGVHNRVLTEVLREYVERRGRPPVSVPVVYRDGSRASADFPLHVLDLASEVSPDADAVAGGTWVLRLALLSIRHTEMDAVVDGAWLRNADVSKPRRAAETDDYVYHRSARQFDEITCGGQRRVRLYVFQTGLETAVVGFLRAVVEFLADHPGRLEVIPMFFAKTSPTNRESADGGFAGYEQGNVWATAQRAPRLP